MDDVNVYFSGQKEGGAPAHRAAKRAVGARGKDFTHETRPKFATN